jgi:tetratricopeptide (TPR) repeat protein
MKDFFRSLRGDFAPHELPVQSIPLVGREPEIIKVAQYLTRQEAPCAAVITGPPGVGKSALAIAVGNRIAGHFRDGALFVQLPRPRRSLEAVRGALGHLATSLQGPGEPLAEPDTELPSIIGRRRLLVVLDDIENRFEADSLLSAIPHGAVIMTSRRALPESGENFELSPVSCGVAYKILATMIGSERLEQSRESTEEIIAAAQGVPFALQAVGTSLALRPGWPLSAAAARMTGTGLPVPADQLAAGSAFDLCYALLTTRQRKTLEHLALLGDEGAFSPRILQALMSPEDERSVTQSVDALARSRLIQRVPDERSGRALLRVSNLTYNYARRRLESLSPSAIDAQAGLQLGRRKVAVTYKASSYGHIRQLMDKGNLEEALNAARATVTSIRESKNEISQQAEGGSRPVAWPDGQDRVVGQAGEGSVIDLGLATAVLAELHMEMCLDDAESIARRAIDLENPDPSPVSLRCLALMARRMHHVDAARQHLTKALAAARAGNDEGEIVRVMRDLAVVEADAARTETAIQTIENAEQLSRQGQRESALSSVLCAHGVVLLRCARLDEAEKKLLESAKVASESEQRLWVAWADFTRAEVLLEMGRPSHARDLAFRAMDHFTAMRHRYGLARCRLLTGRALEAQARWPEAAIALEEAVSTFLTCNDRWIEAYAMEVLSRVLHLAYPSRQHEASRLLTVAMRSFRSLGERAAPAKTATALSGAGTTEGLPARSRHAGRPGGVS